VDHFITARRPDIIVIDKDVSLTVLIHVSIPAEKIISASEEEKITKYQDLRIELERLWKTKTKIVPIVVRALGSISKRLDDFLF